MRAVAIEEFRGPENLKPMNLPRPVPTKGEVLVRVVSAGVNLVDTKIRRGQLADLFPHQFPLIPGWDVAGVVEEFGEGATRFRKGDRVWGYARKPTVQWGCYAEYVTVPQQAMSLMPAKLLFEEAAAVPLAGLTAYQCLFGRDDLGPDKTVLIHAAGGGVGHFAVQLAKNAGARVLGTGGADSQSFIMGLGAEAAIDYTKEDFRDAVRRHRPEGVDLVVDGVGGDTLTRSLDVVKRGGRLVSIAGAPDGEQAAARGITAHFLFSEPSSDQLEQLGRLFDQKKLVPHVQKIYSLSDAAAAHTTAEEGHVRGKLVLNL